MNGKVHVGPNGVGGEWGHNPLPWATGGRIAGAALLLRASTGALRRGFPALGWRRTCAVIRRIGTSVKRTRDCGGGAAGDAAAKASIVRLEDSIGRALASVVNLLDPDVIVIGGGLSKLDRIYANVPPLIANGICLAAARWRLRC